MLNLVLGISRTKIYRPLGRVLQALLLLLLALSHGTPVSACVHRMTRPPRTTSPEISTHGGSWLSEPTAHLTCVGFMVEGEAKLYVASCGKAGKSL